MVACESGYFSLGSSTTCTPCPAGYKCSSTNVNTLIVLFCYLHLDYDLSFGVMFL